MIGGIECYKFRKIKHGMFENNSNTNVKYCIHIYSIKCEKIDNIYYIPFIYNIYETFGVYML